MKFNFKLSTNDNCSLHLVDKSEYLVESFTGISKHKYRASDIYILDFLILHDRPKDNTVFLDHSLPNTPKEYKLKFDGWYTMTRIMIPTIEWAIAHQNELGIYDYIYVFDKETKHIKKRVNEEYSIVSYEEVLMINPIETTLVKKSQDFVSICYLQQCYTRLCYEIFNKLSFAPCWDKDQTLKHLHYKRDLVKMVISVIEYHVECNRLSEVGRLLQLIYSCNGICKEGLRIKSNDCGCSQEQNNSGSESLPT